MNAAVQQKTKGERTQSAILDAAEEIFAKRGFAATRMADIAEAVGIQRASLVYHFKGKEELYSAVLTQVFGDLSEQVRVAYESGGPLLRRIEACVNAWIDFAVRRPTLARLVLREITDADPEPSPEVRAVVAPIYELMFRARSEGEKLIARDVDFLDVMQFASFVFGSTVFFLIGVPVVVPAGMKLKIDKAHIERHRRMVLEMTRWFLTQGGLPDAPRLVD
ncbi:MAG: TetR/AcrR family transcriptional regulator [Chrysiogenetes bacterium]|nr:TetR/AcrR family transcriptional regulator [Chrysiogenetes bacterium]